MQTPPRLLPTTTEDGQAPGVKYQIAGELVPILHVWLDGTTSVFFEHHVALWKDPGLNIGMKGLKGGFRRMVAGMPTFMTEAQGPGEIAFSRDGAGHVFPIHLPPGQSIEVREHQFLAATGQSGLRLSSPQGNRQHADGRQQHLRRPLHRQGARGRGVVARLRQRLREDAGRGRADRRRAWGLDLPHRR